MARSRVRTRERRLLVGGRGWHVQARPCTEGKGRLADGVGVHRTWAHFNYRGAARTRRKRACCASSREKARGGAFACAHTRTPAGRRRPRLERRNAAVYREIGTFEWHSSLSLDIGRLQLAQSGAHMPQARVLRLLPRESSRRRVRVCAHANAGCLLEAAAGTSEQGRAPRERAISMAQWASMGHAPTPISGGAARARRKRACCASSRERVRGCAYACAHTRTPADRRSPWLARRSAAAYRKKGPSK